MSDLHGKPLLGGTVRDFFERPGLSNRAQESLEVDREYAYDRIPAELHTLGGEDDLELAKSDYQLIQELQGLEAEALDLLRTWFDHWSVARPHQRGEARIGNIEDFERRLDEANDKLVSLSRRIAAWRVSAQSKRLKDLSDRQDRSEDLQEETDKRTKDLEIQVHLAKQSNARQDQSSLVRVAMTFAAGLTALCAATLPLGSTASSSYACNVKMALGLNAATILAGFAFAAHASKLSRHDAEQDEPGGHPKWNRNGLQRWIWLQAATMSAAIIFTFRVVANVLP